MLNFFVSMQFYESVHINQLFLESKPWQLTGPLSSNHSPYMALNI